MLFRSVLQRRPGERLAAALQDMGPSFIKLGQALSTRADLLSEQVAADLAKLQDHLPAFPGSEARRIIEAELGQPVEALFQSFDDVPVAAASIAQKPQRSPASGLVRRFSAKSWSTASWCTVARACPSPSKNHAVRVGVQ